MKSVKVAYTKSHWLVLLLTLTLLLAAVPSVSANVTITYGFTGGKRATDDEVIAMFNEANAGRIEVTGQNMNVDSLKVATIGGSAPEIALVDRFRIASLAASGFLRPLDDLIARDGIDANDFFPPTWNECMFDGKMYCLPRSTDTRVM